MTDQLLLQGYQLNGKHSIHLKGFSIFMGYPQAQERRTAGSDQGTLEPLNSICPHNILCSYFFIQSFIQTFM